MKLRKAAIAAKFDNLPFGKNAKVFTINFNWEDLEVCYIT